MLRVGRFTGSKQVRVSQSVPHTNSLSGDCGDRQKFVAATVVETLLTFCLAPESPHLLFHLKILGIVDRGGHDTMVTE